ncbi:EamA-like transporter family protein [Solirubrobacter pauli]|uniref:EamA-like transporter family protein n=1 Tax=Solirubrobacter pauli TaxID=166793 RepID=A0A660LFT2_9ACTN|nr:EamA-like transporter family protein [Solirubrobacter pauli]
MNGWIKGAIAASVVGASFPVSGALTDYSYTAGQLIRYALGALILIALLKGRLGRPTLKELALLNATAAVGMVGFNLAVLAAVDHIGATNAGVIIGASPVVLALATGHRQVLPAALVVVAGAAIVNGADSGVTLLGTLLAIGALVGEVGFTLLAAPLLPRLGPMRVAAWAAILATVQLAVLSRGEIPTPTLTHTAAILYLAVITTALAFVLWFSAVQSLGSGRAGLLVGFMPIAAVAADAALNGRAPSAADLAGTALVAIGIALGARPETAKALLRGGTRAASAAASAGTSSTCPAASSSPAGAPPAPASRR